MEDNQVLNRIIAGKSKEIQELKAKIEKSEDRNRKLGSKVIVAKCLFDDIAEGLNEMSKKLNK